jgi:hypothetical protein
VKSKRRGHVQIGVDVMDVMKSPENGNPVVRDVPPVEGQVHQQKRKNELRSGGLDDMHQSERGIGRPSQRGERRRSDEHCGGRECQQRHHPVDDQACE